MFWMGSLVRGKRYCSVTLLEFRIRTGLWEIRDRSCLGNSLCFVVGIFCSLAFL